MLWFNYLSEILEPFVMDAVMEKAMLNCSLGICENDFMSMFEGCPNNELLELLKTKKHARIFVHMLKYFENKNHILHNSISESKSLIKKYKSLIDIVEFCLKTCFALYFCANGFVHLRA